MTGEDVRKLLSKNIKKHRAQKGMSQAALAEAAGISLPFISSIEQSSKWPYPDTLAQIATALEIEVSDLFATDERESQKQEYAVKMMKTLVENQKKALDDFGERYLR